MHAARLYWNRDCCVPNNERIDNNSKQKKKYMRWSMKHESNTKYLPSNYSTMMMGRPHGILCVIGFLFSVVFSYVHAVHFHLLHTQISLDEHIWPNSDADSRNSSPFALWIVKFIIKFVLNIRFDYFTYFASANADLIGVKDDEIEKDLMNRKIENYNRTLLHR